VEIYNCIELQEQLENLGQTFNTSTDVEDTPHLYEEYGMSFVEFMRGMFSFALLIEE
jgi:asparagine synthase (glutamine-hydrolysing)